MRAYLSSLPQPMSCDRTLAYSKVIEQTPFNENAWERVALVEAREIISQSEPDEPMTFSVSVLSLQGSGRSDFKGGTEPFAGCIAMAEALSSFLSWDLQ